MNSKHHSKRKLFFGLLLGVLALGAVAFKLSDTALFKGTVAGVDVDITDTLVFRVLDPEGSSVDGLAAEDFHFFYTTTTGEEVLPLNFSSRTTTATNPLTRRLESYTNYEFHVIFGEYEVELSVPGYETGTFGPYTSIDKDLPLYGTDIRDINLSDASTGERFGVLRMNIEDQSGNFIHGIENTDFEIPAGNPEYNFVLGVTGEPMYELSGLDEGIQAFTLTLSGYVTHSGEFNFQEDQIIPTMEFTMESAYLIEVRDSTSTLSREATVKVDGTPCSHLSNRPGRYSCVIPPSTAVRTYSVTLDEHQTVTGAFPSVRDSHDDAQVFLAVNMQSSTTTALDTDQDGLSDGDELVTYTTDPNDSDSDDDGLEDGDEINTHQTDPNDSDTDNDTLTDGAEVGTHHTDPKDSDSDDDTLTDGAEITTHRTDPKDKDSDNDGLDDNVEINQHRTDPKDADSDNGGASDGQEINTDRTNPLNATDDKTPVVPVPDPDEQCENIEVDAYPTEIDSDEDDEDLEIEITVELDIDEADWSDTLIFETEEDGRFEDEDGHRGENRIEVEVDENDERVVVTLTNVEENIGNTVTVSLENEDCEFEIDFSDEDDPDSGDCDDPFLDTGDADEWPDMYICPMYEADIVQGKTRTLFAPWDQLTRAEWIKILMRTAGYTEDDADELEESFIDVRDGDWYSDYVKIAEDLDVIRTEDFGNYFNPNTPITRGDAVLYAVRLADETLYDWDRNDIPFDDLLPSYYATYAVLIANDTLVDFPGEGEIPVIQGYEDDSFRPYNYLTRAEAMAIAIRASIAWLEDMGGVQIEL